MSQPDGRATILPPTALSPAAARDFTYDALAGSRLGPAALEKTVLVVDELVTHAVTHAAGPIMVAVTLGSDTVYVEVTEESDADLAGRMPSNAWPDDGVLPVVRALSRRWGTRPRAQGGCTVWADVVADREQPPPDDQ